MYIRPFFVIFWMFSLPFLSCHAQANQHLNQLKLADSALLSCISEQASINSWQSVGDVDVLKCHGKGISNLEGLQALLTQLESLSLYNNKLQHADLRYFKALEHLNVAGNQLETVNVSGLSQLETLSLFKNSLKTVDFKGLSQLKKIRITNNLLETYDCSLRVSRNLVVYLD